MSQSLQREKLLSPSTVDQHEPLLDRLRKIGKQASGTTATGTGREKSKAYIEQLQSTFAAHWDDIENTIRATLGSYSAQSNPFFSRSASIEESETPKKVRVSQGGFDEQGVGLEEEEQPEKGYRTFRALNREWGAEGFWVAERVIQEKQGVLKAILPLLEKRFPLMHFVGCKANRWRWQDSFNEYVANFRGLEDHPERGIWKRYKFLHCTHKKRKGLLLTHVDDSQSVKLQFCNNAFCLQCAERNAKRLANEYVGIVDQLTEQGVMHNLWCLTATIPEEQEARFAENKEATKELRRLLPKATLKAIGQKHGKNTKSNAAFYVGVHQIAGDVLRDRVHLQAGMFPVEVNWSGGVPRGALIDGEGGEAGFPRFEPLAFQWISTEALEEAWNKEVGKRWNFQTIAPQIEYISTRNRSKINHRLRYDLRSFAKDFQKAVVACSADGKAVVIEHKVRREGEIIGRYYWVTSTEGYAARWVEVRGRKIDYQPYGWLKDLKQLYEAELLEKEVVVSKPVKKEEPCEVETETVVAEKILTRNGQKRKRIVYRDRHFVKVLREGQWVAIGELGNGPGQIPLHRGKVVRAPP